MQQKPGYRKLQEMKMVHMNLGMMQQILYENQHSVMQAMYCQIWEIPFPT